MADSESVTRTLKENVPILVGVPEMVPFIEIFKPGGRSVEVGANDQL